VIDFLLDNPQR